jgi:C4-dicarboxylate-specific signal transduction histidine kinase
MVALRAFRSFLPTPGSRHPLSRRQRDRSAAQATIALESTRRERQFRETQMELAHANRVATMGQLTASIAHEVRQPIAATVNNAQAALHWLSSQPPDLEEARQALGRIVRDASRASEVIGSVHALVGKAPPQKDALAISEAILEVIGLLHGEALKHRVTVQVQLADGVPPVHGDRVALQQVVLNLIMNAIEAMSSVGIGPRELLVSSEQATSGEVLIAVRDTGPGLDAAQLERLFEAFHTTKPGGLGLGLSICRSIVEAHGGRLWATAWEPQGALFQFTIPAA